MRAITDIEVKGKRLLVRADLNVPLDKGRVADDTRIRRFAEGMAPLLGRGARLAVLTHLGRPEAGAPDPSLSVGRIKDSLAGALGTQVDFSDNPADASTVAMTRALGDGEALLCENLRFHPGETANDKDFAAALAELGDVYVNDAFSCAHRAHASTEGVARILPAYAGPLMMAELEALNAALGKPAPPAAAIIGGAKISTKIAVLENLARKLDHIIIGGAMANTFLLADGAPMGTSLHETDQAGTVAGIRALAAEAGCRIHLPADVVVAEALAAGTAHETVPATACPDGKMILDAGPGALAEFQSILGACKTILWNGPLGAFEVAPFGDATMALARTAAELTKRGAISVAGGGDTVAALNLAGVADKFTYVSTAGGAFLEWLEGKTLPGIAALEATTQAA